MSTLSVSLWKSNRKSQQMPRGQEPRRNFTWKTKATGIGSSSKSSFSKIWWFKYQNAKLILSQGLCQCHWACTYRKYVEVQIRLTAQNVDYLWAVKFQAIRNSWYRYSTLDQTGWEKSYPKVKCIDWSEGYFHSLLWSFWILFFYHPFQFWVLCCVLSCL